MTSPITISTKQELHAVRDTLQSTCDQLGIRLGKGSQTADSITARLFGFKDYNRALASLPTSKPEPRKSGPIKLDDLKSIRPFSGTAEFSVAMLSDQTDRTLMYGYTLERETFHVYLQGGIIHKVIYTFSGEVLLHEYGNVLPAESLIPDKRAYPERCDLEFCQKLSAAGHSIPFTTYDESRADPPEQLYSGYVVSE